MMKSFYDSLETLQKVQFATKKDYINLGIGVLISIVIFGAFFIGVDTIWSGLYKSLYGSMRSEAAIEQSLQGVHGDDTLSGSLLDGVEVETVDGEVQVEPTTSSTPEASNTTVQPQVVTESVAE